jgi:hypothetical protein
MSSTGQNAAWQIAPAAVASANFLTLFVAAWKISNRNFKNALPALGEFEGNLNFEPEIVAPDRYGLQRLGPDTLIPGFHIA